MANKKIVLGAGCFWCTEAVFRMFKGIVKTTPGYAGGHTKDPTYKEVCSGDTGHAEVVMVEYNDSVIPAKTVLDIFMAMHDPTSLDRQGADTGSQYRSAIYCIDDADLKVALDYIGSVRKDFGKPIVTEVRKLDIFYPAEDYHSDYFAKNPLQPYCMVVIGPKLKKIRKEFGL